jgi:hypothetical protein
MNHEIVRTKYTIDFVFSYILFSLKIILTKKAPGKPFKHKGHQVLIGRRTSLTYLVAFAGYNETFSFYETPT